MARRQKRQIRHVLFAYFRVCKSDPLVFLDGLNNDDEVRQHDGSVLSILLIEIEIINRRRFFCLSIQLISFIYSLLFFLFIPVKSRVIFVE